MDKFDFLKEPFKKWVQEKRDIIKNLKEFDLKENTKDLLMFDNELDINQIDKILKYISELGPPFFIDKLLKRFAYHYSNSMSLENAPVFTEVKFEINNLPNALEWTIVNVAELRFFDMNGINYNEPYNQCHYCGEPDEYEHKSGTKRFNSKVKYCHDFNCDSLKIAGASNPMLHEKCHYGIFAKMKKRLYQQMRTRKLTKEEKIKLFLDFCEERLIANDNISWNVQTKDTPAKFHDEWFEI